MKWIVTLLTGDFDGCRLAWLRCWIVWEWRPFSQRARSWQAGLTLGPYRLMVEYVSSGEWGSRWRDPVSVWLRLYYGDVRRCDIPIMADWIARTE